MRFVECGQEAHLNLWFANGVGEGEDISVQRGIAEVGWRYSRTDMRLRQPRLNGDRDDGGHRQIRPQDCLEARFSDWVGKELSKCPVMMVFKAN